MSARNLRDAAQLVFSIGHLDRSPACFLKYFLDGADDLSQRNAGVSQQRRKYF